MLVKLSIKIPSSSGGVLSAKVAGAFARALDVARPRIQALVVERASTIVNKLVPDFATRYKTALRARGAVDVTEKAITITITDPVVKAVERGSEAFDMKPGLLAHGKPAKGGGVYVDVPIQHKAGAVPQATRTAARRAAAKTSGVIGEVRVPRKTEGKAFTRDLHRGPVSQALGIGPKKQEVKHKRGIHDDVIRRSSRTRGGGWSASYVTIRRVSSRSSPSSWHHPGFKARRALDDVLPGAKREIAVIIRDAFSTTRGK